MQQKATGERIEGWPIHMRGEHYYAVRKADRGDGKRTMKWIALGLTLEGASEKIRERLGNGRMDGRMDGPSSSIPAATLRWEGPKPPFEGAFAGRLEGFKGLLDKVLWTQKHLEAQFPDSCCPLASKEEMAFLIASMEKLVRRVKGFKLDL